MELSSLNGRIIGIISDDFKEYDYQDKLVKDLITKKVDASFKMVKLDNSVLNEKFSDLPLGDKNKVILANQLHNQEIILVNFSKGLIKKDLDYFKSLFKKIANYGKKIILVEKRMDLFLNCVDRIYVINEDEIKYETIDIFDKTLGLYADYPKIVEFYFKGIDLGVRLDQYTELDELLKAIYRIKS